MGPHRPKPPLKVRSYRHIRISIIINAIYVNSQLTATPETTPLREFMRPQRPFPVHSNAARTIWGGNSSQPSSPLKRDDHFRYPDMFATNATSEKFLKMMIDRNEEKHKSAKKYIDIEIQNPLCDNDDTLNVETSREDDEVTEINKLKMNKMTENRPTIDKKDIRSRQNLMKCHELKDMEDCDAIHMMLSMHNEFEQKSKKLSNNTQAGEAKTVDEQNNVNCTVETQTDITMPLAWSGLLDKYVESLSNGIQRKSQAHVQIWSCNYCICNYNTNDIAVKCTPNAIDVC